MNRLLDVCNVVCDLKFVVNTWQGEKDFVPPTQQMFIHREVSRSLSRGMFRSSSVNIIKINASTFSVRIVLFAFKINYCQPMIAAY